MVTEIIVTNYSVDPFIIPSPVGKVVAPRSSLYLTGLVSYDDILAVSAFLAAAAQAGIIKVNDAATSAAVTSLLASIPGEAGEQAEIHAPVADLASLRGIVENQRSDKMTCYVEGVNWLYAFDAQGTGADTGTTIIVPNAGTGIWNLVGASGYRSITASTTAVTSDRLIKADATAGPITVTLYTAVGNFMRDMWIKRVNGGANSVIIAASGGQTVDGAATRTLTGQWETLPLVSDGANWLVY